MKLLAPKTPKRNLLSRFRIDSSVRFADLFCIAFIAIVNLVWFWSLIWQGDIMGDDIGVFTESNFGNSPLWQELLYQGSNRYRPVFELVLNLYSRVFGNVYELYFIANLAINIVISILFFYLLKKITKVNYLLSMIGTLLYVLAPFAYYNILQVIGVLESYSLLFLMLMMHQLVDFCEGNKKKIFAAVVFLTLLMFTHERYIVMSPWCVIIVLCGGKTTWKEKIAYCALALMPMCLNIFLKEMVFGSRFLEGTAFAPIEFNIASIITHFVTSLATILGLNIGPEYLNGFNLFMYPGWMKLMALFAVAIAFFLLGVYIVTVLVKRESKEALISELKVLLAAVSGMGALLLCASVTIRVEMRWLYAPFIIYILYYMYIASKLKLRSVFRYGLLLLVLTATLVINYPYQKQLGRIFFPKAMQITQNVYESTVERYGESLKDYELYFIGNEEAQWAIGYPGRSIFDVYFDFQIDFKYAESMVEVNADYCSLDTADRKTIKVYKIDETELTVVELDAQVIGKQLHKPLSEYTFSVSPQTPAETPSGEGVFRGKGIDFTVLSGYTNEVENVVFPANALFYVDCSMPFELSDGAKVIITMDTASGNTELAAFSVYPGNTNSQAILVEILNQSEQVGDICIEVQSPSGDAVADWVVFSMAGIYTDKELER